MQSDTGISWSCFVFGTNLFDAHAVFHTENVHDDVVHLPVAPQVILVQDPISTLKKKNPPPPPRFKTTAQNQKFKNF